MLIETITNRINHELLTPSWAATKQLLTYMEVEFDNQLPKIESIVIKENIRRATGYVAVKGEPFYIGFHFDIEDQITIHSIDTEPHIHLHYQPTSEDIGTDELLQLTKLVPTEAIKKGTKCSNGKFEYIYNGLSFESSDKLGSFEDKLDEFLAYLEQDVPGIKALIRKTETEHIFVTICYYIANRNFTGLYVPKGIISRLNNLGLTLVFDLHALGKAIE